MEKNYSVQTTWTEITLYRQLGQKSHCKYKWTESGVNRQYGYKLKCTDNTDIN